MQGRNTMKTNDAMVDYLIRIGALHSDPIIEAFRHVDRADFVGDAASFEIYEDHPLHIGGDQTISQPQTVAMMLEMLSPSSGQKILDIGSGSGWTTALLAFIVGESGSVVGVERIEELVEFGRRNLEKYGFKNATIVKAKESLGREGEEFDRILVSAAAQKFPKELSKQMKRGAKIVIPVQNSIYEMTKTASGELEGVEHYGFVFVPLLY